VREVEVEPDPSEAQVAIERAIETLDREARGEPTAALPETGARQADDAGVADVSDDASGFAEADYQPRNGSGLTIFLIVFAILLAGAGGAGFWAWREGYVDLDRMFGQASSPATETVDAAPTTSTLDPVQPNGPGNTATTPSNQPAAELDAPDIEDRLEPTPE